MCCFYNLVPRVLSEKETGRRENLGTRLLFLLKTFHFEWPTCEASGQIANFKEVARCDR